MHASPALLRDTRMIRDASLSPLPVATAVRIARSLARPVAPGLEFLTRLEPCRCIVTGTFAGLDVTVEVSDDRTAAWVTTTSPAGSPAGASRVVSGYRPPS